MSSLAQIGPQGAEIERQRPILLWLQMLAGALQELVNSIFFVQLPKVSNAKLKKYGNFCTQPTERGHFRGYKLI